MKTLDDAIQLATEAHRGAIDKIGEPYILHPIRVMLSMSTPKERMVAVLHDVIEDTDITKEKLLELGFDKTVVDAVDAMSKRDGESWDDFIKRCCMNPLAINVKRADISDNSSPIRLYKLDIETRMRLRLKYMKAINYIDSVS